MNRRSTLLLVVLLSLACAAPPPPAGAPAALEGLLVRRDGVMAAPPATDLGPIKVWVVEKTPDVVSFLIRLDGVLPLHYHPDGVHRMYVIEGRLRAILGTQTKELGPGDYIMIPVGVRHRFESLGGPAVYASVDTPPVDPKQIVWIEPKPVRP